MVTVLLILLPAGLIFLPSTILLAVGMIPTVVAYVVDRDPDKTAPMTVGGLNFAGVVTFLISLWQAGHTMTALTKVLTDPFAWLVMYGAAGLGWALYYGIPPAVAGWIMLRAEARIAQRIEEQRELIALWGTEVNGIVGGGKEERSVPAFRFTCAYRSAAYWARRCSIAAFLMFFWSFSNARTSIWRTRSRLMP